MDILGHLHPGHNSLECLAQAGRYTLLGSPQGTTERRPTSWPIALTPRSSSTLGEVLQSTVKTRASRWREGWTVPPG